MVPMATQAVKPTAAKKKRALRQNTKPLLLIALPGILYLLINNYLPMIGIFLAFKDYSYIKGPFKSNWCGFKNFEFLFRSDAAFTMIRNTLAYNVVFIITTTVLAITLAIMMNELNKLTISKFFQGSLLLPNLVSMVIVSYLVYAFLNPESGLLNNTLELLHLPTVNWYSEPKYWPMILVVVNAWKTPVTLLLCTLAALPVLTPVCMKQPVLTVQASGSRLCVLRCRSSNPRLS